MQDIFRDNSIQYVYTQLFLSNGNVYEGLVDGESLLGAIVILLPYKMTSIVIDPATVIWIDESRIWRISLIQQNITQYGKIILSLTGTDIATQIIEVNVTVENIDKIIELIFTGTVINSGTGLVTFTGSDGSTIVINGDNLGNRSGVILNIL